MQLETIFLISTYLRDEEKQGAMYPNVKKVACGPYKRRVGWILTFFLNGWRSLSHITLDVIINAK